MSDAQITLAGRLTRPPELNWTPSGAPVAKFSVACNARKQDKTTGEWVQGDPSFWDCVAWRDMAENIGNKLNQGDLVLLTGRIVKRPYEAKDGTTKQATEITVEDIGLSLKWKSKEERDQSRSSSAQSSSSSQGFNEDPPF